MENNISIKVSNKVKTFIKQIQINRIKLDLEEVTQTQALELIVNYFKLNNSEYVDMIKGGKQ